MSASESTRDHLDLVYIGVEVLIAVASVLGNVLVCWAVKINRALRDTTFCFIVSLALADIAVGGLAIPVAITISLGLKTQFYSCLFITCILITLTQSSILSLLAIAVDRYLRARIPTKYKTIVTQKRAWIAVGMCWLGSILIGLTPMFGWHNRSNGDVQKEEMNSSYKYIICNFTKVIRMDYMVYFNFFGWVLLPLIIMFGLYAEIFCIIRKQLSKVTNAMDSRKYFGKELKLAKSLALVLFLFAACWIPLHAMNTIWYFCPQCNVPKTAFYIGIFLSHVNSAVNPVIYAFRIKKFRTSFLQIWNKYVLCKKGNLSMYSFDGQIVTENNFNSSV
ncbi:adenosine receptor A1-like [Hemiscyllium ocellatum]|uniref:adenosine receptor A1-like n=1 Tax=Hemiscyllium ocellatum TaxID=170820 RepID=UPI002966FB24|nr:adenosine receptor A1-like [Hemiscyllium ocellatum]